MAINSDIRDQAYQFFCEEAPELLQLIETNLLTLLEDKSTAKVHKLMRAAHSLKGGAASVELEAIATLSHRLETIFMALYNEALEMDTELESQLLQAYDCLRLPLTAQITQGEFDHEQALALAEPIFAQIEERLGDTLNQAERYLPSSTELGVDLNLYIFEVDVQEGIEHLLSVISQPQDYEVVAELQAKVEVFAGFAEILDQPEFSAVAQATLTALDARPHHAIEIIQLAIIDFQAIRQAVLSGVGTSLNGQYPSVALLELAKINRTELDTLIEDINNTLPSFEDIFGWTIADRETENEQYLLPQEWDSQLLDASSEFFREFSGSIIETPQGLADAVPEIEQVFGLPPLPDSEMTATTSQESSLTSRLQLNKSETNINDSTEPNPDESISNLSVKVKLERLERMNNLVGELASNRHSLSLQNEQLQDALRELSNRFVRVESGINGLQELARQSSPENVNFGFDLFQISEFNQQNNTQFDSLELDRYGVLPSRLHRFLEEITQIEESVNNILLFATASDRSLEHQRKMLAQLRDQLMWVRMLPINEVLQRFPRILHDLATTYHKSVNLKLSGTRVLVDKAVLEKLYDPLLHLLRNAFDHGIESINERRQKGKPEQGTIEVKAYHQGSQTIIEIRDDGGGLNLELIRTQALVQGLLSNEQLAGITDDRLFDLIFQPGFSTTSQVSEISGRGVGLDIVRLQLRLLKGTVTVHSSPGIGTTFTLRLPITLSIAKLLVCFAGSTVLAILSDSIEEIIVPKDQQIKQSANQRFLVWRDQLIPVYYLADFLVYACQVKSSVTSQALTAIPTPKDWELPILVLRQSQEYFAVEIDRLVTEQELAIKPFGSAIASPLFTYGCTTLGDSCLIPVLDVAMLLEPLINSTVPSQLDIPPVTENLPKTPTILVVDDAVALRRTLAVALERAGYQVLQAPDGQEAIAQLKQNSVELVICDIEMPNMNGFEFLGARRQEAELAQIPVVMLTSRSNDKHRRLAMQLGATDYFTKPYLEREFLNAIKNILGT